MIKIKHKNSNRLRWIISLAALLLLAIGALIYLNRAYLFNTQSTPDNNPTINYDQPTDQQVKIGNDAKQKTIDESKSIDSTRTNPTITITSHNVTENTLRVRTLIDNISTDAKCKLTLTEVSNTTNIVTQETGVHNLPNASTCKGFDVPIASLSSSESWLINITYTSSSARTEVSKTINLSEQG